MLFDSNPHLLSGKDSLLSIRQSRNCDFSCIKVIVPQSKAHILLRLPKIGRNVIEYSYVSGQYRQTIKITLILVNIIVNTECQHSHDSDARL